MKRVFIIAGLLPAIAGSLLAQNQSADCVLDRFLEDVKEAPALQMDFLWNQTTEGTLILQENMFVVHLDEFHVYCNGREKWLYNQGIDEWEELPHDAQAAGILENPSAFLHNYAMVFIVTGICTKGKSGGKVFVGTEPCPVP